jgi:hypothetical protein
VTLRDPSGAAVGASLSFGLGGGFMEPRALSQAGTYSLVVDPTGTATGSLTIALYDVPPDAQASLAFGTPSSLALSVPGQNGRATLAGTAGQRVSVRVTASVQVRISLLAPDGGVLAGPVYVGSSGGLLEPTALPVDGVYTVLADPSGAATGSVTLTPYDVPPDATATLSFSSPLTVSTTVPGQNAAATFTGSAGKKASLKLSNATMSARATVLAPDGTTFIPATYFGTTGGFVEPKELPQDGVYTVLVDPSAAATGSVTLTLYDVPPDVQATLAIGGSATLAVTVPGQNALATFDVSAGQARTLRLSSVTISLATVRVTGPDGATVVSTSVGTSGKTLTFTPAVAGVHTLYLDPQRERVGSVTLTLS